MAPRSSKRRRSSRASGVSSANLAVARALTKIQRTAAREDAVKRAIADASKLTLTQPLSQAISEERNAEMMKRLYGRGKYSFGSFLRQGEGYANRFLKKGLPNLLNAAAQVKSFAGQGLYSGRGGYNNLVTGGDPSMVFGAENDETESITIQNCEFLQDVYGAPSAAFFREAWNLNPGLAENFPWLAQIAQNYEEYEFIQLLFHYKSTVDASAVNNTNGSTGTIIMATNYNPAAPLFTNKETMMQYHGANTGRVTEDHTHGVECDPDKNAMTGQKYIRSLPVVIGQDLKTYDLGTFQLAQANIPSAFFNQQIGELWVTYTVRLRKPKLSVALLSAANEFRALSAGGESVSFPLGNNILYMQQNTLPISLGASPNSLAITFPDFITGLYEIRYAFEGGSMSLTGLSVTLAGSVQGVFDIFSASSGSGDAPQFFTQAASASHIIIIVRVLVQPVIAGVDNVVTINTTTPAGTVSQGSLVIRQCNNALGVTPTTAPNFVNSLGVITSPIVP